MKTNAYITWLPLEDISYFAAYISASFRAEKNKFFSYDALYTYTGNIH